VILNDIVEIVAAIIKVELFISSIMQDHNVHCRHFVVQVRIEAGACY
jgi:hypothetical protein